MNEKKITTTLTWQWPPQKRGLTPVDKAKRNEIVSLSSVLAINDLRPGICDLHSRITSCHK